MKEIIFSSPISDYIEKPTPSLLKIPKSYKNMANAFEKENSVFTPTVKKCIPFLDAMTIGYVITSPMEYLFKITEEIDGNDKHINFQLFHGDVPEDFKKIVGHDHHDSQQVSKELRSNYRTVDAVPKFMNPWHIKTPPGYSCIFTTPFNRNLPFKIVDGVVDTDIYTMRIHFPYYWTQDISKRETILPKGTPIALVIPFKRDSWKMKIEKCDFEEEEEAVLSYSQYIIDKYKRLFWKKKSYR